jgi:NADPH:quinone reductase-like Zn-dependent oxidoreductase
MHKTQQQTNPAARRPTFAAGTDVAAMRVATYGESMRAAVQHRYGSAEQIKLQTIARPAIAPNEVLIEVHAAGLDRGTWHLMTGTPYLIRILGYGFRGPKQPTLGLDVAGRVIAIGSAVTRFAPGDEVFGIANGSFAEYAAALEDKLAHKPAKATFEQAAVAAVSGITALHALTDVGRIQAGQRVLIVGASGGVGTFAVQLAKALGAEVTGVASADKLDLVRSLGADHVIDYASGDLTEGERQYDLIIDIGGRNKVSRLRRALSSQGTVVFVGGEGGNRVTGGIGRQIGATLLSMFFKHRLTMFISLEHYALMERLSAFIQSGAVTPSIGQRFDLAGVPRAMRQLEAGEASGKTVIVVRPL